MLSGISFFIYFYCMKQFIIIIIVIAMAGFLWFMPGCKKDSSKGNIPTITLIGSDSVIAGIGYPYHDAGATAQDEEDGDLTSKIVSSNNVDTAALGTYHVYFNVTDSDGNNAKQVVRTVKMIYTK
jgi:hypothetical protein